MRKINVWVDTGFTIECPTGFDLENLTVEEHQHLADSAKGELIQLIKDGHVCFTYDEIEE